ncbi:uncharacterized protein BDW70DRAFT_135431 [Aspergillus foveolatus]|uniref:uncharacterized protein n=1 Tax=Aspergillus foveolatus TaxID=210207 RepID=UPI003CCD1933
MSQQNGVFPSLASIETAPPTHGSGTTSIARSPSHSGPPTSYSSSTTANNSTSSSSGTISTRVHIPKLSAATTELLARIAGNIKGTQQKGLRRDDPTTVTLNPSPLSSNRDIQNIASRRAGKMKVSSTIIELPTFPFVYPTRVETPVVPPSPACVPLLPSNDIKGATSKSDSLANIAPKPTVPRPTSTSAPAIPRVPVQTQLPLDQSPASNDVCEIPARPHNLANIAPKPAAPHPTSIPVLVGPHQQAHTRLQSEHQSPSSSRINVALANRGSVNIAPKPAVLYPRPTTLLGGPSGQTRLSSDPPPSNSIHGPLAEPKGLINAAPEPLITNLAPMSTAVSGATAGVQRPPERQLSPPPPLARAPTILKVPNLFLLKSSTAVPIKTTSTVRQRRESSNRKSGPKKRKRGNDSDSEDIIRAVDSSSDESDVTPTATQTTSGRQVKRPSLYVPPPLTPSLPREGSNLAGTSDRPQTSRSRKPVPRKLKSTNIRCCVCDRGHSPTSNTIVFCDRCNRAWHQHCHDPPIQSEVVAIREKEWLCRECKPANITILHPTVVRSNPSLTSKPPAHPPLTIPRTEVGGERFSTDCRRRFLSTLSHAALVELLLTISNNHPTVPMFPENMESLPSSNFAASQAIVTGAAATPTSLPTNENNIASVVVADNIDEHTPEFASGRISRRDYRESSDEESEYEFQDHRVYPRAGNGLCLSTNEQDLDILREDPTCSTFSYALHAPASGAVGHVSA